VGPPAIAIDREHLDHERSAVDCLFKTNDIHWNCNPVRGKYATTDSSARAASCKRSAVRSCTSRVRRRHFAPARRENNWRQTARAQPFHCCSTGFPHTAARGAFRAPRTAPNSGE
jgi:hypothetical protein